MENKDILRKIKDEYNNRVEKITDNHYIFYPDNVDDMNQCIKSLFYNYANYFEYKRLTYPCYVLIYICSEKDTYENYYEDRVYVKDLNVFQSAITNYKTKTGGNKNEK